MKNELTNEVKERRKANYDIHPLILNRWSPRSMTGDELTDDEIMALFEAARWAPSSYNAQLWRFLYAKRNAENWDAFFNLLTEGNQAWAKNAAVLVMVISGKNFEHNGKPAITHIFDAGASWENLALEATNRGLVAHGVEGFDYEKARQVLNIPDDFDVLAMIALGRRGKKENLPEKMQMMEAPNDRRPLNEIVIEGKFKN